MLDRRSLAPDVDGHITLQDHMAGKEFGYFDFGLSQRNREDDGQSLERQPSGQSHTETIPKFRDLDNVVYTS